MPRSKVKIRKRELVPDPLYHSRLVSRLVNRVVMHGKKSRAEKIVYGSLARLSPQKSEALAVLEKAVKNVMPVTEVRSRRVGGATYQVPLPVRHDRSEALALRWIIGAAKGQKGHPMEEKLYSELKAAAEEKGDAFKKKENVHRMAEANRAFAHFRW